jgi:putative addiction module killer protein
MLEFEIRHYLTPTGRDPFGDWLDALRDHRAAATILLRIGRLQRGLLGVCKPVGGGVFELQDRCRSGLSRLLWPGARKRDSAAVRRRQETTT